MTFYGTLKISSREYQMLTLKKPAKNVDFVHLRRGEGGQQKVTVLFTFENDENVGWPLN